MAILIVIICITCLVLLITWVRLNAFLSFLIISILAGLLLGLPVQRISQSVSKGVGDILSSLLIIISTGAMLGKLIAYSGAAEKIALVLMRLAGRKQILWALLLTGFIIGLPLFFSVGFVLVVPIIYSVSQRYKLPAAYVATPMLVALSTAQGFLPPHPAPAALVQQFHASMGKTLLFGMAIAIPAIIIAGPLFARTLRNIQSVPAVTPQADVTTALEMPGTLVSFASALMPVFLLIMATLLPMILPGNIAVKSFSSLAGDPATVMLFSVLFATITLGVMRGTPLKVIMPLYADGVKEISMILLVMAGAGALKQVLLDSGISDGIGRAFLHFPLHPLILAWLISALIRVCLGSATIAGLTTAGIIAPLLSKQQIDPNLMVLAIGAGSLMFSYVNDPAFWMFKEYFNLGFKDTMRSWSLMESIVSVVGLLSVLLLNQML